MMSGRLDGTEIAIVGMAGRFPGAPDVATFWDELVAGREAVRRFTDEELDAARVPAAERNAPGFVPAGAPLDGAELFDAGFFGYSHREAEILDPQQRIFLETCWQALEDAGHDPAAFKLGGPGSTGEPGGTIGVFGGATTSSYLLFNLASNPAVTAAVDPLQLLVANAADSLTTRVAYKLGLTGPAFAVQSACSTSLVAVHLACQALLNEECDLALAGGVSVPVSQRSGYRHRPGSILSPDGRCRPFDAGAAGTVFGSGAGVVVLRRAEEALADGDCVRALIRGSAVNNDGSFKVGYTAPSVDGQAQVIAEALAAAGVDPETIGYVEAHGTGTALGDPIEIQALTKAFRAYTERTGFCAIGSVKASIGHLDVAAGVAGLIKTVLALEHGTLPASLHYDRPNPKIDFAGSPVYVNSETRPWPADGAFAGAPRRAGVSSFGFGGTNVHVVLEEAPPVPVRTREFATPQLLVLSARSPEALAAAAQRLADRLGHLDQVPGAPSLADVAWTLQTGRRAFDHRLAVVAAGVDEAREKLAFATGSGQVGEAAGASGQPANSELETLARRWLAGETPTPDEWAVLHDGPRRRVPLPTYPFERQRYWIERQIDREVGASAAAAAAEPAIELHPRPELSTPYVAPRTALERTVAGVWGQVLGVDRVGLHDNFFDLGGDSLIAVHAIDRLQAALDQDGNGSKKLPVVSLYEGLTVAALVGLLEEAAADGSGGGGAPADAAERLRALETSRDRRKRFQQQRRDGAAGMEDRLAALAGASAGVASTSEPEGGR